MVSDPIELVLLPVCTALPAKCTAGSIPNFSAVSTRSQLACTSCLAGSFLSKGQCGTQCPSGTVATADGKCTGEGRFYVGLPLFVGRGLLTHMTRTTSVRLVLWDLHSFADLLLDMFGYHQVIPEWHVRLRPILSLGFLLRQRNLPELSPGLHDLFWPFVRPMPVLPSLPS